MNTVFLAFANSTHEKLDSLQEEDEKVYDLLSRRKATFGDVDILREQYATTGRVMESLSLYQNQVQVFLYSGHAGRDRLLLEDQDANAEGIAALLRECPEIKLVILNGCSTKGQVTQLLDSGVPIVIATSSPVEDKAATRFSIGFFKSFVERSNTIGKAFDDGIAAAQVVANKRIAVSRGRAINQLDDQTPPWGISYLPQNEIYLDWRLGEAEQPEEGFEVNKLLLEASWQAIHPFLSVANKDQLSRNDRLDRIITELPHPVSEFLRRLIASRKPGEEDTFYNEPGPDRLQYLLYTYTNCIDILAITLLAQLWDEKTAGTFDELPPTLYRELEQLFDCDFRSRKNL